MENAKFYYIKRVSDNMFNNGTFDVVILKGAKLNEYINVHGSISEVSNNKEYRVPIISTWGKKVFIRGLGYISTKRIETIPVYDGKVDSFDDYILKYGYQCLFYSLTGYSLYDMDCCTYNMQREFRSLISSGMSLEKYEEYVNLFNIINEAQMTTLKSYPFIYDFEYHKYLFRPSYSILGIANSSPYVDTIDDDDKMERLYCRIRLKELRANGIDKSTELINIIDKEVKDGILPVCPKDRMRLLFGDDCVKAYTTILEDFKID